VPIIPPAPRQPLDAVPANRSDPELGSDRHPPPSSHRGRAAGAKTVNELSLESPRTMPPLRGGCHPQRRRGGLKLRTLSSPRTPLYGSSSRRSSAHTSAAPQNLDRIHSLSPPASASALRAECSWPSAAQTPPRCDTAATGSGGRSARGERVLELAMASPRPCVTSSPGSCLAKSSSPLDTGLLEHTPATALVPSQGV